MPEKTELTLKERVTKLENKYLYLRQRVRYFEELNSILLERVNQAGIPGLAVWPKKED